MGGVDIEVLLASALVSCSGGLVITELIIFYVSFVVNDRFL